MLVVVSIPSIKTVHVMSHDALSTFVIYRCYYRILDLRLNRGIPTRVSLPLIIAPLPLLLSTGILYVYLLAPSPSSPATSTCIKHSPTSLFSATQEGGSHQPPTQPSRLATFPVGMSSFADQTELVVLPKAGTGNRLPIWLLALCGAFTAVGMSSP